jgi:hypothetical protein
MYLESLDVVDRVVLVLDLGAVVGLSQLPELELELLLLMILRLLLLLFRSHQL